MDEVSHVLARTASGELQEVAPGIYLLPGFGNWTLVVGEDGVAVIDPGLFINGPRVVTELRKARDYPPTLEYEDRITLHLGDRTLVCRHGLGETADHTWIWIPERSMIVGGDFIVSLIPNAGTPFRVRRYGEEWLTARAEQEPSFIARNILRSASVGPAPVTRR